MDPEPSANGRRPPPATTVPAAADGSSDIDSESDRGVGSRLSALEHRVRTLEAAAQASTGAPSLAPQAHLDSDPDARSQRIARGAVAARLAALGHPSRLELLAGVGRGAHSTAALSTELGTGSTGQLYHHLNQLVAAGWLRTTGRGRYEIPVEREQALIMILAAAGAERG